MRRTRLLILLAILLIIGSVGITYTVQKGLQERQAPPPPTRLPEGVTAQAPGWRWSHVVGSFTKVEVLAKDMRQVAQPASFELHGVELHVFNEKKPNTFDKITSALAQFDTSNGVLFSDGEVNIEMGLPSDGKTTDAKPLHIKSSGVRFDSKAGKISTDRQTSFEFGKSDGAALGAEYDSNSRELRLAKNVVLNWKGKEKETRPMQVTSDTLVYKEVESKVYLTPKAKLTREQFTLESADSIITLKDGVIELVEAQKAHGDDTRPDRKLNYAADVLKVNFTPEGVVQNVVGENNATLTSTNASAATKVDTRHITMEFEAGKESTLKKAVASGGTVVESKPVPQPNVALADTRFLRSDTVELNMRPGGQDVERIETHSPGVLEFVPNRPTSRHRTINGERMWISYGAKNVIQNFRAVDVRTQTDRETPKGKPPLPPAITTSKNMEADFDDKGQATRLEQWERFEYQEGDRRAKSDRARLDEAKNLITLTTGARAWDATGSTEADQIVIDQKTDSMSANGHVASTHVAQDAGKDAVKTKDDPKAAKEQKAKPSAGGGLMQGSDPIQARADQMTGRDHNNYLTYSGNAVLWQGANRITGDLVNIDRKTSKLDAHGNVTTQLIDHKEENAKAATVTGPATAAAKAETKADAKTAPKKDATPVFTTVKASDMVYTDADRLAHYTGSVTLVRPGLTVTSKELRAWMTPDEPGKDSTLDKAFADGDVKVVQKAPDRTRTGTGEHAEYYLADERMVMTGGDPLLVDSLKGNTRGTKLTWFAREDKLLVESGREPGVTNLKRKRSSGQ